MNEPVSFVCHLEHPGTRTPGARARCIPNALRGSPGELRRLLMPSGGWRERPPSPAARCSQPPAPCKFSAAPNTLRVEGEWAPPHPRGMKSSHSLNKLEKQGVQTLSTFPAGISP